MPPAAPTPLTQQLTQRIQQHGPITYAEWMAAALYHPQHGYYRRGQPTVGPQGDFLTSPEVHPVFGAAVARLAQTVSESLGHPDPFRIVEVGPGSGALAESLLTALEAQLHTPISLTLVEADHAAAQTQRRRLANFRSPIEWRSDIADAPADAHLVLANELLDAQPVHRLRFEHGAWTELLVGCAPNGAFHDCPAPIANPALSAPLQHLDPQDRQIVEISPARADLVAALANLLTDGLLLLFDYGYPRRELYDPRRRNGTLMTFRNHTPGENPYAAPGEHDITCHIDLDQVLEAATAAGLTWLPPSSQSAWLDAQRHALLASIADPPTRLAARRALEALCDPEGLGRITVITVITASRGELRSPLGELPGLTAPQP